MKVKVREEGGGWKVIYLPPFWHFGIESHLRRWLSTAVTKKEDDFFSCFNSRWRVEFPNHCRSSTVADEAPRGSLQWRGRNRIQVTTGVNIFSILISGGVVFILSFFCVLLLSLCCLCLFAPIAGGTGFVTDEWTHLCALPSHWIK